MYRQNKKNIKGSEKCNDEISLSFFTKYCGNVTTYLNDNIILTQDYIVYCKGYGHHENMNLEYLEFMWARLIFQMRKMRLREDSSHGILIFSQCFNIIVICHFMFCQRTVLNTSWENSKLFGSFQILVSPFLKLVSILAKFPINRPTINSSVEKCKKENLTKT